MSVMGWLEPNAHIAVWLIALVVVAPVLLRAIGRAVTAIQDAADHRRHAAEMKRLRSDIARVTQQRPPAK